MRTIQFMSECKSEGEAVLELAHLETQDGFLGGRVLAPNTAEKTWRTQSFYALDGEAPAWLPDGCQVVIIPNGQRKALGLAA